MALRIEMADHSACEITDCARFFIFEGDRELYQRHRDVTADRAIAKRTHKALEDVILAEEVRRGDNHHSR